MLLARTHRSRGKVGKLSSPSFSWRSHHNGPTDTMSLASAVWLSLLKKLHRLRPVCVPCVLPRIVFGISEEELKRKRGRG